MDRRSNRIRSKRTDELMAAAGKETDKRSSSAASTGSGSGVTTRSSPGRIKSSPTKNSPVRLQTSSPPRTRRTSKPRTIVTTNVVSAAPKTSPIKEEMEHKLSPKVKLSKSATGSVTARVILSPLTKYVKTSPKTTESAATTPSVHSLSSVNTQKTLEIDSSGDLDIKKLTDYIRRSVSRTITGIINNDDDQREGTHTPTTNVETESRYSRSISRSIYDDDEYSDVEHNDNEREEDNEVYKSFNATTATGTGTGSGDCRQLPSPREFGGWIGIFLLLLLAPTLIYYTQWTCSKTICAFKPLNVTNLLDIQQLVTRVANKQAIGAYFCYIIGVFTLCALLYGRRVRLPTDAMMRNTNILYKFNTLTVVIVLLIAFGVAEYLKYGIVDFVLKHYLRFYIYGIIYAYVFSFWNIIRERYAGRIDNAQINLYGRTGNYIVDYGQGRQLNPKWLGLIEYKQVFYSISLITTLFLNLCFIYKTVQIPWLPVGKEGIWNIITFYARNIKYDSAALFASSLVLIYILDAIIFEHHLISSFELQGEGFGCLLMLRYAATPFLLNAVAKYFFERRVPINCQYAIYVTVVLLIVGLSLKRLSNAVKYKYRIDPLNSLFYGIETIHTYQGKRLLLGSLWGRLRQPNYTGDILALIALSLPLSLRFAWPPLISILSIIILLLHRASRVNARNRSRYFSSWIRYCQRVPNYVLPKVY